MEFFENNKFPILGGIVGLFLALLLIGFGIFKTLVLLFFVAIGSVVGWYLKETGMLDSFFNKKH